MTSSLWSVSSGEGSEGREPDSGTRFGDYELLEEIARGGMGVVYRARQLSLKRVVAVKMVLFGQFAGKHAFERFRAEAETIARLQHPNIVAIHEIGETDGQPYFSMDYVAGRSLADRVGDRPMPARQAAEYVRKIARAVHYAHTQGVLHRDLKPANVLVDDADEPRITDFGLARRLAGDSELTLTGQVVGSPNFMPPEQGLGKKVKLGPASDVYGLGALLYYLMTARAPFVADTFEATLSQVLNNEPAAPRQLNPGLPVDMETICLKCLEKDPARRYASAQELADELDRFLQGKPTLARPLGSAARLWRWCRRKPAMAGMSAAVILLLLTVTAVSLAAARRVAAQARRTEQNARDLRLNLYVSDMTVAYQEVLDNDLATARQILSRYVPHTQRIQDGKPKQPAADLEKDLRGWEWRYLWNLSRGDALAILRGHPGAVSCTLFSPDGATLATASFKGEVIIWSHGTRQIRQWLTGFADSIQRNSMAFSREGDLLAVADGVAIHVFATTNWAKVRTLSNPALPGRVNSLPIVFSPDGLTLLCNAHGELRQWDTRTWEYRTRSLQSPLVDFGSMLALSPDGQQFAIATDESVLVCDALNSGATKPLFKIPIRWPMSVAFSPDSRLLAVGGPTSKASVWDAKTGRELYRFGSGLPLSFSPDSRLVATTGIAISLWEVGQPTPIASLKGHTCSTLTFAPDGHTLASGGGDGTVALWAAKPQTAAERQSFHGERLGFSEDGKMLAVLGTNSMVEYLDLRSGSVVSRFRLPVEVGGRVRVTASPDVRLVAAIETNGLAWVWEPAAQRTIAQFDLKRTLRWPCAVLTPNNRFVAISSESLRDGGEGWVGVWDLQQGQLRDLPYTNCYRPSFSSDGRILATGFNNQVQLWNLPDLTPLRTLAGHKSTIKTMVFSQDNALLASTGRSENGIRIWDVATGRQKALLAASSPNTLSLVDAFSKDSRTIASCDENGATLWNVATGRPLFTLLGLGVAPRPPMFSPDGNKLVAGGALPTMHGESPIPLKILNAPSMEEIEAAKGL